MTHTVCDTYVTITTYMLYVTLFFVSRSRGPPDGDPGIDEQDRVGRASLPAAHQGGLRVCSFGLL